MIQLDPAECRVLGVLVEKAHTSSAYPMSLNAITDGCNQKSNRDPVVNYDEDAVMLTLDRLRDKRLVVFADILGSRVTKFRHNTREALGVDDDELVLLVELMLRGPQTAAELRVRASRMRPLSSADVVHAALQRMIDRPEPMAMRIGGGRAERFAQLLCPGLHPLGEPAPAAAPGAAPGAGAAGGAGDSRDADRIARLEAEVADLRLAIERLAEALGASDILKPPRAAD